MATTPVGGNSRRVSLSVSEVDRRVNFGDEVVVDDDANNNYRGSEPPRLSIEYGRGSASGSQGKAGSRIFMTKGSGGYDKNPNSRNGSWSRRPTKHGSFAIVAPPRFSIVPGGKAWSAVSKPEPWYSLARDVAIPLLVAGLSLVGAGILLDFVLDWEVYHEVAELLILVTPLLGLKDLEMTLASRLSTHANLGHMDVEGEKFTICLGNLALDQLQAVVCGLIAAIITLIVNVVKDGHIYGSHVLLLCSAGIFTMSTVSLVLGSLMVGVVLISKRLQINPDNIAPVLAGSLGVATIMLLSVYAHILWSCIENHREWIPGAILAIYVVIAGGCTWYVSRNKYVKDLLVSGWIPLMASVIISTAGGTILESAEGSYPVLPLFQPLITGIGGNLGSLQASRIATKLHFENGHKVLHNPVCQGPWTVFFKGFHAVAARVLLLIIIPGHAIFVSIAWAASLHTNGQAYNWWFLLAFIVAALIQVAVLLYVAQILCNFTWSRGMDPDMNTIPYVNALADLLGSGLLLLAFVLVDKRNQRVEE